MEVCYVTINLWNPEMFCAFFMSVLRLSEKSSQSIDKGVFSMIVTISVGKKHIVNNFICCFYILQLQSGVNS